MRIKYDRVVTRSEMERVLLEAPCFAHHSEAAVSFFLNALYGGMPPSRDGDFYGQLDAVPSVLKRAHDEGHCPQLFSVGATVEWVARKHGRLCCICGANDRAIYTAVTARSEGEAILFDHVLELKGRDPDYPKEVACIVPACKECANSLTHEARKAFGHHTEELPQSAWVYALSRMFPSNPGLKKRIAENAAIWKRLRFDPRRPHPTTNHEH